MRSRSRPAPTVTNVELVAILRIARELPSLRDREPAEIDARVHAAFDRLTADGLEGRLKALGDAALDEQTRRRMFTAAAVPSLLAAATMAAIRRAVGVDLGRSDRAAR